MKKLRLGIILVILSWMPFAQVMIHVGHNQGYFTTEQQETNFRLIVWSIQVVVGLIGVWLAGRVAIKEAKRSGLRQTPANLWHLFWHGKPATEDN